MSLCIRGGKTLIGKWLLIVSFQLGSKCEGSSTWKDQKKPNERSNFKGKMKEIGDGDGKTAPLSSQKELPDGKTKARIGFNSLILVSVGSDKVESD